MANEFLTLKDLAARDGTSDVIGTVEHVVNVAPELDRVIGRTIDGTHDEARVRKSLPTWGGFRKINQGVYTGASAWTQERFNCGVCDMHFQLDQALIQDRVTKGDSMGKIVTDEQMGLNRSRALGLGLQFYQGTDIDPLGPAGLVDFIKLQQQQLDSRTGLAIDHVVDCGGSEAGACQTAWFIFEGPQGVHWLWGAGTTPFKWDTAIWQMVTDANGKRFRAFCGNSLAWIGLAMANYYAIAAIKNIDVSDDSTKTLTDALCSKLYAKLPIGMTPTVCFASKKVIAGLQGSRTTTLFAQARDGTASNSGAAGPVAPWPTNLPTMGNIPIIPTDSIISTNAVTAY